MCSELGRESLVSVLSPYFLSWALTSLGFGFLFSKMQGAIPTPPAASFRAGREGLVSSQQ